MQRSKMKGGGGERQLSPPLGQKSKIKKKNTQSIKSKGKKKGGKRIR